MTARALQVTARRLQLLRAEIDDLQHDIDGLVTAVAPWLLELPGVGPITAAQVLVSWSHAGRWRSEAAFAALAGTSPIPASSGRVTRYRLNRRGDRQLNNALHTIAVVRLRDDPLTRAYALRRTAQGKNPREIKRCLKRIIARQLYKLLERTTARPSTSPTPLDRHSSLGIFPNDAALLRLAGALLIEQYDEWLVARRYLSQESLELVLVDEPATQEAAQLTSA
jgi:transposase